MTADADTVDPEYVIQTLIAAVRKTLNARGSYPHSASIRWAIGQAATEYRAFRQTSSFLDYVERVAPEYLA